MTSKERPDEPVRFEHVTLDQRNLDDDDPSKGSMSLVRETDNWKRRGNKTYYRVSTFLGASNVPSASFCTWSEEKAREYFQLP